MAVIFLSFLTLNHYALLPNIVAEKGFYAQEKLFNLIAFSLYSIASTYYFIRTEENTQKALAKQKQETENLLKILVHDVAQPLEAMNIGIDAAKAGGSAEALSLIELGAQELASIVGQVRKLRAVQDGKVDFALDALPIGAVLADAIGLCKTRAEQKGIALLFSGGQETACVKADAPVLKNVIFANPLGNAIKFSHPGQTVEVRLNVSPTEIAVEIEDHGIGIPAELLRHIFDPAAPTTRAGTRGERGTGYGMPLAKVYAEKLGGTLTVASRCGGTAAGTVVRICLPRCADA